MMKYKLLLYKDKIQLPHERPLVTYLLNNKLLKKLGINKKILYNLNMSAKLNKNDVGWQKISMKFLSHTDVALLEARWDHETDWDEKEIKAELSLIKQIKKLALLKLLLFIPETAISLFLFSLKENQIRNKLNVLYIKLLFNKINYDTFKKELLTLSKNDIILI